MACGAPSYPPLKRCTRKGSLGLIISGGFAFPTANKIKLPTNLNTHFGAAKIPLSTLENNPIAYLSTLTADNRIYYSTSRPNQNLSFFGIIKKLRKKIQWDIITWPQCSNPCWKNYYTWKRQVDTISLLDTHTVVIINDSMLFTPALKVLLQYFEMLLYVLEL